MRVLVTGMGGELGTRVATLIVISVIMTVGVYGLVAGIVKHDDLGLMLSKKAGAARSRAQPSSCKVARRRSAAD